MNGDVIEHATHVVAEVLNERVAQEKKWGVQNHAPADWMTILGEEVGEACKAALEWRFGKEHRLSPAQARERLLEYRKELIQVAAVAVAAAQSLTRNELADLPVSPPDAPPRNAWRYWVNGEPFDTQSEFMTGKAIMAMISEAEGCSRSRLFEEASGNTPDRPVPLDEGTSIVGKRFYTVPPATFGKGEK